MPPVRWKFFYVVTLALVLVLIVADAQLMQDAMSADGWRPIIGSRRQPPGFILETKAQQITEYKNPSQIVDVDIVKAETPISKEPSSTAAPQKFPSKNNSPDSTNNNINGGAAFQQGEKIPPHTKFTSPGPYHTLPTSVHGPPIPIGGALNKGVHFGTIKKRIPIKTSTPSYFGLKRKPIRGQMVAHSNRNEVFVRPPASFPFINQAPSNIKTRETQGLGLLGSNHFIVNQPSGHIEFANRFAPSPNEENFQQGKNHPITFIFSKPTNDINYQFKTQNDEYTRNLVPPPPLAVFQQDTDKIKPIKINQKLNENTVASTEPIIRLSDFNYHNIQFGNKPVEVKENLVPQLPPAFEQNFAFQKQFQKPIKEQAVDVQVTKEKLKVFSPNQPINYNANMPDYVDYDFHSLKRPVQLPKVQTYEVTEGKWLDNPNPFTFSVTKAQPLLAQPLTRLPSARPQLVTEPIVELNVPPFLPTPYRPQGVVPTSPTQSEVSTVFSQVSTKMNRYKNEALSTNPFFFDVKEVSTHFPILGIPELKPESSTSNPLPMDPTGEISNEITTPTPTQQSKPRRRRPRPRRPPSTTTTTTTTTTTEEPPSTESYELQKTEENFEEMPVETERPQTQKRRQRPNRHRTSSIEERPLRYRTTTPASESEESSEKRVRTRQRTRQRGSVAKSENRSSSIRKRIRPTTTEMPLNHKMIENDVSMQQSEASEPFIEQVQSNEKETQGIFETKYPGDNVQSPNTKTHRLEYESPNRHYEPTQYEEESKYETTIVSNDISPLRKPTYEESEEAEMEGTQGYERNHQPISETTESETTANIHLPENEIDYSTSLPSTAQIDDRIQTTIATTVPTTTTTETTTTTTKSHRIRGRPIKSRPRFSVKDYRQRLNQYTSTTPSTTTDIVKTTPEGGLRLRFPSRLRTRPTSKTTTTTAQSYDPDDEENSEPIRRGGFKPKEPRHSTTESSQDNVITEKYVKSVTTRLRPFGRQKSTTESSIATQKVSIKPNLFSVRRRPPQLSLRNKIHNKYNSVGDETTTNESQTETTESVTGQTTETDDVPTEFITIKTKTESTTETAESTTVDLNEDDYIQRVSDLTSSFKNEYETPGLFKSVSPNSRRIPNYFTISTEDPILPIEAFFPNIKDKEQK